MNGRAGAMILVVLFDLLFFKNTTYHIYSYGEGTHAYDGSSVAVRGQHMGLGPRNQTQISLAPPLLQYQSS